MSSHVDAVAVLLAALCSGSCQYAPAINVGVAVAELASPAESRP
eukprot:CAMPEP_0119331694 /NCGR_PEP_ID=MMETSP1333-20130426/81166_1 /TAXON_ID=418940 /ORGANISM="Scyphosphaera apsteinii, Strain RCC1455" /LENGTH=43 /DNA_ID= /DNA_START= /DNA_END= /DNA_ORIENTATION=